jgi:hypothetical protein
MALIISEDLQKGNIKIIIGQNIMAIIRKIKEEEVKSVVKVKVTIAPPDIDIEVQREKKEIPLRKLILRAVMNQDKVDTNIIEEVVKREAVGIEVEEVHQRNSITQSFIMGLTKVIEYLIVIIQEDLILEEEVVVNLKIGIELFSEDQEAKVVIIVVLDEMDRLQEEDIIHLVLSPHNLALIIIIALISQENLIFLLVLEVNLNIITSIEEKLV